MWATACPGKNYPYREILEGVRKILRSNLVFTPGYSVILFKDNRVNLEKEPVILRGVTFFPLRDILELIGYTVDWDQQQAMVVALKRNDTINLWPGRKEITINGKQKRLDHEVINIWGTIVVPFRSLMELLCYNVNWLPESGEVQAVKH